MQNSELTDLESTVQALVRRAYELGRNDVLKRVVDVLKTDQPSTEHLALAAPKVPQLEGERNKPTPEPTLPAPEAPAPSASGRPWYMRPVR